MSDEYQYIKLRVDMGGLFIAIVTFVLGYVVGKSI